MDKPTSSPRFRFSLLTLFGFVGIAAVVCAGLSRPSKLLAVAITATVIMWLLFAVLATLIFDRGPSRSFWAGVAVVGLAYFGLELAEYPYLPTNLLSIMYLAENYDEAFQRLLKTKALQEYEHIRTWIGPLLFGFFGGLVGRHLYLRRERLPKN